MRKSDIARVTRTGLVALCLSGCGGGGGGPTTPASPAPVVVVTTTPPPTTTAPPPTTTPAGSQPPAVGSWSVTPSDGPAPLDVTAKVCNGTPSGSSVSVDFGEGGGRESPGGCQPTHTYRNPGQFRVTAYVTDSKGQEDHETKSVNVTAPATLKVQAVPNGCMVDISVDVGTLSGREVVGLAVTKVSVTLKRSTSKTVDAQRVGSTSTWKTTQDMSSKGLNLGSGSLDVGAEAFDGGKSLAKGSDPNKAVSCSS